LIERLLKDISDRRVCIPAEVWMAWGENMGGLLNKVQTLVSRETGVPIAAEDVETLNIYVQQLVRAFKLIRRGTMGKNSVKDGVVYLDPVVKDLMAHYVGNDLYKIALMVDVNDEETATLPAEVREKILRCIGSIYVFIERLKRSLVA
jgi:hypothetical protein